MFLRHFIFSPETSTRPSSCYSEINPPTVDSPSSICPDCGWRYANFGVRRKLVDSCGHSRCYECMFENERCPECSGLDVLLRKKENRRLVRSSQRRKVYSSSDNDSPTTSSRSSGRGGRESGFQSYMSINSSNNGNGMIIQPPNSDVDDFYSDTSSVISLMSTSTAIPVSARPSSFIRASSQRRSLISNHSERSFRSRNGFGRRSLMSYGGAYPIAEMSAIMEGTSNSGKLSLLLKLYLLLKKLAIVNEITT